LSQMLVSTYFPDVDVNVFVRSGPPLVAVTTTVLWCVLYCWIVWGVAQDLGFL